VFSYETYVSEAKQLVVEAKQFNMRFDDDPTFQRWKHRLEDVVRRARANGYLPECETFGGLFRNTSPWPTTPDAEIFVSAVEKTVIEHHDRGLTLRHELDSVSEPMHTYSDDRH